MSSAKRGRGRPRRQGADEEILAVVRAILEEHGYRALSVDDIAARAGVAKTTVYRRWPSKGALVAAAIEPAAVATGSADEVLQEARMLLAPFADADDDAEILGVLRNLLAPRREALAKLVGEERADELLGAVWMQMLIRGSSGR